MKLALHERKILSCLIKWGEFIALGKKHDVPTFIDCAADVPLVENLFKFTIGFDQVVFSGGKGNIGKRLRA